MEGVVHVAVSQHIHAIYHRAIFFALLRDRSSECRLLSVQHIRFSQWFETYICRRQLSETLCNEKYYLSCDNKDS